MDAAATNFLPSADYDDGEQCAYAGGCMASNADNFDASAQYDNGSCIFNGVAQSVPESEQYTLGCMDEAASNFLPSADYDDGEQCTYIGGCTQQGAQNFNPSAQYDDGSCAFAAGAEYALEEADYTL